MQLCSYLEKKKKTTKQTCNETFLDIMRKLGPEFYLPCEKESILKL